MLAGDRPRAASGRDVIAGVIPCAGASRRMGRPKALLDAGGRSFLERIVSAHLDGGCDRVLVVIGPDGTPGVATVMRAGAECVRNPDPSVGPISSMRAALEALGASPDSAPSSGVAAVLWHPVDHPLVSAEAVEALIRAARDVFDPDDDRAPALAVPRYRGGSGHPVLIGSALFGELFAPTLEDGVRTVTRRHQERRTYCDVECAGVTQDIDTPGDYRAAFSRDP